MCVMLAGCGVQAATSPTAAPSAQAAGHTNAGAQATASEAASMLTPGAGGDAAWWEEHSQAARTEDEKTAAGFVLAVLKRDIGALGGQAAGIDAFFEPAHADLKSRLAPLDISSPSAREATFASAAADDTGTTYTFKLVGGTAADSFQGFEGELQFHVNGDTHRVDKVLEPTFDAAK